MRIIILLLSFISSTIYAQTEPQIVINSGKNKSSVQSKILSRSKSDLRANLEQKTTQLFPTHVIRLKGSFDTNVTCHDFFNHAEDLFSDIFNVKDTTYWFYMTCSGLIGDDNAQSFGMWLEFDAWSDEAINTLHDLIAQTNGIDFYSQSVEIEPVTGIVAAVNLDAGVFIPPQDQTINKLLHADNKLYFNKLSEMQTEFLSQVWPNLFSTNSELVKAFLTKWLLENGDDSDVGALMDSNYIGLEIEPIFIFKKEPRAYMPYTIYSICSKTKKGVCKSILPIPQIKNLS